MISPANRLRSVGWLVLLGLCLAVVVALALRVNALRSEIHHAEARIVALKQEKMYLETEFETRSNQQQLKAWNDVEFGYAAPGASQYLEGERQLAQLSVPATPDAPAPIRVASVDDSVIASAAFPAMVSPLSGKPVVDKAQKASSSKNDADEQAPARQLARAEPVETLKDRLGKVVDARPRGPVRKETASKEPQADKKSAKSKSADSAKAKPAKAGEAKSAAAKPAAAKAGAKGAAKSLATADKSGGGKAKSGAAPRAVRGKEAKAAR